MGSVFCLSLLLFVVFICFVCVVVVGGASVVVWSG